jgi:hypothetical protein
MTRKILFFAQIDGDTISADEYTVFVRPTENVKLTKDELLAHFSTLYGEEDWTFPGWRCYLGRKMQKRHVAFNSSKQYEKQIAKVHPFDADAPVSEGGNTATVADSEGNHGDASNEVPPGPASKKYRYSIKNALQPGPVMNATNSMDVR